MCLATPADAVEATSEAGPGVCIFCVSRDP